MRELTWTHTKKCGGVNFENKVKVLKMAVGEEGDLTCPGEGCPEPLKVPITLTYVLYTEGERILLSMTIEVWSEAAA